MWKLDALAPEVQLEEIWQEDPVDLSRETPLTAPTGTPGRLLPPRILTRRRKGRAAQTLPIGMIDGCGVVLHSDGAKKC